MDKFWIYTAIALGIYIVLSVADDVLKKHKARKVANMNDRSASNSPVGTGTADE